jgi:hypothetical protein
VDAALHAHFGQRPLRASVSFVGVEPIEVLRFEAMGDERSYLTLGMAQRPMIGADVGVIARDGPRAELLLQLRDPTDAHVAAWRRLAVLAAAPAVEGVVYTAGMTLDLGTALSPASRCTAVLVTESVIAPIETSEGEVAILRVVPMTAAELAWCRARGSAALRALWSEHGTDLLDLTRGSVPLDSG